MKASVLILSALSGCVWGVIGAYLLTDGRLDARSWGGLVASPLIGIAAGMAAMRFRDVEGIRRILIPLVTLYAAAALFGFAAGAWNAAFGVVPLGHSAVSSFVDYVFGILVGLTVSGYVLFLWPLVVMNHFLIWRWSTRQSTANKLQRLDLDQGRAP